MIYHTQSVDHGGFGVCGGPQLLWVILQNLEIYTQGRQPIYYDKLILGCEEKNFGRVLPPTKFFSKKATEKLFNLLEHFNIQANHFVVVYLASKIPSQCESQCIAMYLAT